MSLQIDAFPTALYEPPQPFMVVDMCPSPSKGRSSVVLPVFLEEEMARAQPPTSCLVAHH